MNTFFNQRVMDHNCLSCSHSDIPERHALGNFQDDYAWCDKVGGKHYAFGWCDECNSRRIKFPIKEIVPRPNKYLRNKKYREKLRKLCWVNWNGESSTLSSTYYPVVMDLEKWIMRRPFRIEKIEKPFPRKYSKWGTGGRAKFWKDHSNGIIRRYKGSIKNGYICHKLFDYKWTID